MLNCSRTALCATTVLSIAVGVATADHPAPAAAPAGAKAPAASQPIGLKVGEKVPQAMLLDAGGAEVPLSSLYAQGPVVVVFYRGGWCPYCTKSLEGWDEQLGALKASGARLVAISPEKPDNVSQTVDKNTLEMTVLSDARNEAGKAFGLMFDLPADLQKAYKGYGVDLAAHNASGAWSLPHPGTFIIDTTGTVRFASVNPDYRVRPQPAEVLEALAALKL